MRFEKFVSSAQAGTPEVSVSRLGVINFNKPARELAWIKAAYFATLYYDKDTRTVGIEPTMKNEGGFRLSSNSGGTAIRCPNFFKMIGWEPKEIRRYALTKDEETGFLVFTLTK